MKSRRRDLAVRRHVGLADDFLSAGRFDAGEFAGLGFGGDGFGTNWSQRLHGLGGRDEPVTVTLAHVPSVRTVALKRPVRCRSVTERVIQEAFPISRKTRPK
jgi:hypothetical protein